MNKIYKDTLAFMEKEVWDKQWTCSKFKWVIEVAHGDGSHFVFQNAVAKIKNDINSGELLMIWTEHCGYHVFFLADVEWWRKYKTVSP